MIAASLLLIASVAHAQHYSPTLAVLENEASKDPAHADSLETARGDASTSFTGEKAATPAPPVDPSGKQYVMEGKSPIPGINIYTPKEDPNGDGHTDKPKAKPLISDKMTYGALGLGAALTVGGLFFTPLLFLGGLLLGAGAVLWFIGRKTKPK